MRFKDTVTGAIVETANEFVVEQFHKHPDRYKEIKPEPVKKVTTDKK